MVKINCQYYSMFGDCLSPERTKILFIFRRSCVEFRSRDICLIKVPFPRPTIFRKKK